MRELKQWSGKRIQLRCNGRDFEGILDWVGRDSVALIDVHVPGVDEPLPARVLLPVSGVEYAQVPL